MLTKVPEQYYPVLDDGSNVVLWIHNETIGGNYRERGKYVLKIIICGGTVKVIVGDSPLVYAVMCNIF